MLVESRRNPFTSLRSTWGISVGSAARRAVGKWRRRRSDGWAKPMNSLDAPARMTIDEIARRLAVGKYAVYKALKEGVLPGVMIGNRWMVSRIAFERWLKTCGLPAEMKAE